MHCWIVQMCRMNLLVWIDLVLSHTHTHTHTVVVLECLCTNVNVCMCWWCSNVMQCFGALVLPQPSIMITVLLDETAKAGNVGECHHPSV